MPERINNKKCIIGPSHIVRWEQLFNNVLTELPHYDNYAIGGLPIWDEGLLSFLNEAVKKYDEIYILIGDFRFGNAVLNNEKTRSLGIVKENINSVNDSIMLAKCLDSLDVISEMKNVKLIFWDLYIREFTNKKSGRHSEGDEYNHPHWNYAFFEKRYHSKTIVLSELNNLDLDFLFIDSSLHPSIFGYNFLLNLVTNNSVTDSFLSCLRFRCAIDKELNCSKPTVIIGNGVFFRTIHYYLSKGIISLNVNVQTSRADDALFTKRQEERRLIFFSEYRNEYAREKAQSYLEKANWKEKTYIDFPNLKNRLRSSIIFEITNDVPNFLFIYALLKSSMNGNTQDKFDINAFKDSLNKHFIRNCLCLS
ncbi:hypothetical protein [Candidatus Pantoea floridensis]|uniref:Uncharacterized protein n=1 Tax=Candidatus Pantoea floridensis TaxID=1938870 RepID=A0A286BVK7_9GAMM|nr:hypothetical protein [Pantoea floridensis]PIF20673.1 hypothetical protein BX596_0022 [Enterobacteriaceae bacterium JKS000233]SOD38190.1 hypothetical protein SAMN06273570_2581 [Pantoea floridensis]